jgi:hypothetical protein
MCIILDFGTIFQNLINIGQDLLMSDVNDAPEIQSFDTNILNLLEIFFFTVFHLFVLKIQFLR